LVRKRRKLELHPRTPVITGIGVVSPIGIGRGPDEFWNALIADKCGISKIDLFDVETFPCQIAGVVRDWDAGRYLEKRSARFFGRGTQFGLVAARFAVEDAGLCGFDPQNSGVVIGVGAPALEQIEEQAFSKHVNFEVYEQGPDPISLLKGMISAPASAIALQHGISGYVELISSTCASAFNALGLAAEKIKDGTCDVILAGGVDAPINRIYMQALCASGAIATKYNDKPDEAMRPFEKDRTRSVLAEGAAILVVESFEHAKARGVSRYYCSIDAWGHAPENTNELFMINREGQGWAKLLRSVLKGVRPDFISAHGPSDEVIDRVEFMALRQALGDEVLKIPVTSTKGATGSAFSAAGALQIAAAAIALHKGLIPHTRNYEKADPGIPLKIVKKPKASKPGSVLVNGHGLSGINTAVLLGGGSNV